MDTTVVGSFPLENNDENFERALLDEINAGVTIPCYPQLVDMNHQVLQPLSQIIKGLSLREKEFHFTGDFRLPQDEIVAVEYGKKFLKVLEKHPELKNKINGMKACLTGPFTLSSNIILDDDSLKADYRPLLFQEIRGHLVPRIVEEMATYIAKITEAYKQMGFTIISIDDPFLSQLVGRKKILFHEREFIINTVNKAAEKLENESSLHVCGNISSLLRDILLDTNVHIMDHEFKTAPRNFELFDKKTLEEHDKLLAYGAIQSNPVPIEGNPITGYVESLEETISHISKAKDRYGEDNMIVKPDCGFGGMTAFDRLEAGLGQKLVIEKLQIMNEAVSKVF